MKLRLGSLAIAFGVLGASSLYGDAIFTLIPSDGSVVGAPGSTVGWGYSLINTSLTDWFVTTNLSADSFANGTPSLIFDFPVIAPGATVAVPFNVLTGAGLYQLTWDVGAPNAFVNGGNFVLSAQWWSGDPFNGGSLLFDATDTSVPYSATVSGASGVPEPATLPLVLVVLVAILVKKASGRRAAAGMSWRFREGSRPSNSDSLDDLRFTLRRMKW